MGIGACTAVEPSPPARSRSRHQLPACPPDGQSPGSLAGGDGAAASRKSTRKSAAPGRGAGGDGSVYVGAKKGDLRHGFGKYTYPNGDWYEGQWEHNKAHGEGTFWTRTGTYVGRWREDLKHGLGTEEFVEGGAQYKGQFAHGFREGKGVLVWPDGSRYEGEFVNSSQQGKGTFTWKSRATFVGQWENNYIHGEGTYTYADGSTYEGQFVNNLKDGLGTFTTRGGRKIEGRWQDGRPLGVLALKTEKCEAPSVVWKGGFMVSWAAVSDEGSAGGDSPRAAGSKGSSVASGSKGGGGGQMGSAASGTFSEGGSAR